MYMDLIFFVAAYLIGSFPSAWIMVRLTMKSDIRANGSGNVGAFNALRVSRKKWVGLVTLLLDLLKGALPAWYILANYGETYPLLWLVTAGLILGHCFSFWLKFKGGRGLAVAAGALLVFQPLLVVIWLAVWLVFFVVIRKHIIATLIATAALPLIVFFMLHIYFSENILLLTLISTMMIFQRHLERIPDLVEEKRQAIQKEVEHGNKKNSTI